MKKPHLARFVSTVIEATSNPSSLMSRLRFMRSNDPCLPTPSPETIEEYRQKIAGTNIDPRSFLSTDYFNTFNSVAMILDMLPDSPELLEEVEQWQFIDYTEHFKSSGLDFADLAVEVYPLSPLELREAFERKIHSIRIIIEDLARALRRLLNSGEIEAFSHLARTTASQLRTMMEEGNGIVHGSDTSSQADIDKLF